MTAISDTPAARELYPSLESGDRLSRAEFWRRFCARPDIKKAELVEGVVYVASPVSLRHGKPHYRLSGWLATYESKHAGVTGADNSTVLLDPDNVPQPDLMLWYDRPGRVNDDDYFVGAPDLVIEVSASSASIDLHDKLRVYRRNGVQEYLVWSVRESEVRWFELRDGEYEPLPRSDKGIIESKVFPGLRLSVPALIAGDLKARLAPLSPPS